MHYHGLLVPYTNFKLFGEQETGSFHEMCKEKLVKESGKDLRQEERERHF